MEQGCFTARVILWGEVHGRMNGGARRKKNKTKAGVLGGVCIQAWYHVPQRLLRRPEGEAHDSDNQHDPTTRLQVAGKTGPTPPRSLGCCVRMRVWSGLC